jgi:hypothetical protein
MGAMCRRCLLTAGMPLWLVPAHLPAALLPISLDDDGVCGVCRSFLRDVDDDALADEVEQCAFEVAAVGRPAILALSGGKDSLATLALCRTHDIDVVAALYDNGFIPPAVIARAQAVCARLGVEFVVLRADDDDARGIASAVADASPTSTAPCLHCAAQMGRRFGALADERGAPWLISGTNYPAHWTIDDDGAGTIRASHAMGTPAGRVWRVLHLPFALRITHTALRGTLADIGVDLDEVTAAVGGISSNCRVPGLVQARVGAALGHVPEQEDLALEVLVGHRERDDALAELLRKAPELVTITRESPR